MPEGYNVSTSYGQRYWRGKFYKTWGEMQGALQSAGIDANQWLTKHPGAQQAYGVTPGQVGLPGSPDSTTTTGSSSVTGSQVIPGVGIYGMYQNQAQLAYEQSLAMINQQQQSILQQYGLQGDIDSSGKVSNVQNDPTSQYGVLPQLRYGHGRAYEGNEQYQANRNIGGLGGGLAAQGEEHMAWEGGRDFAQAFSGFDQAMQGAQQARMQAASTLGQTNLDIELAALQNAIDNQQFTPVDVSEFTQTTTGGTPGTPGSGPSQTGAGKQTEGFRWGGQQMTTKSQMRKYIASRGGSVSKFKSKYPNLWAKLK